MNEDIEVVETTAMIAAELDRASIDVQVATAHRYPRSLKKFQEDALFMATMNQETAESCFYILPRKDKRIEGPSVRLAEIVGSCWGNMRNQARVIRDEGKFIVAQGVSHDLERNVAFSVEVRRRITTKDGKRYSEDMINQTANAACSIALRNAIFRVVPKTFVDTIYLQAKKVAVGDASTLAERREKAIAFFEQKYGVARDKIFKALSKKGVQDVDLNDLETMTGWRTAIVDGDASIDSIFNPDDGQGVNPYAPKAVEAPAPTAVAPIQLQTQPPVAAPVQTQPSAQVHTHAPREKASDEPPPFDPIDTAPDAPSYQDGAIDKTQQMEIFKLLGKNPNSTGAFKKFMKDTFGFSATEKILKSEYSLVLDWIKQNGAV